MKTFSSSKSFKQLCNEAHQEVLDGRPKYLLVAKQKYQDILEQFRGHKDTTDEDILFIESELKTIEEKLNLRKLPISSPQSSPTQPAQSPLKYTTSHIKNNGQIHDDFE